MHLKARIFGQEQVRIVTACEYSSEGMGDARGLLRCGHVIVRHRVRTCAKGSIDCLAGRDDWSVQLGQKDREHNGYG